MEAPFFSDPHQVDRLEKEVLSWLETPWRHRTAVKGYGADCIHFVAQVLHNLGVFDFSKVKIPDYPPDWHLHNTRELLYEEMHRHLNVRDLPLAAAQDGDILLSHYGQAASHAAFLVRGWIYHCVIRGGVVRTSLSDRYWANKMRFAVRLYK